MRLSGLEVDGISKWYGAHRALDSVSFEVRPGELFGFVGGNGAGKTTAMRIIIGVLEKDAEPCGGTGKPRLQRSGRGSGTCRRSAGCIPR